MDIQKTIQKQRDKEQNPRTVAQKPILSVLVWVVFDSFIEYCDIFKLPFML